VAELRAITLCWSGGAVQPRQKRLGRRPQKNLLIHFLEGNEVIRTSRAAGT
jgi:hypothetical protein